jgi:hypothetical protein
VAVATIGSPARTVGALKDDVTPNELPATHAEPIEVLPSPRSALKNSRRMLAIVEDDPLESMFEVMLMLPPPVRSTLERVGKFWRAVRAGVGVGGVVGSGAVAVDVDAEDRVRVDRVGGDGRALAAGEHDAHDAVGDGVVLDARAGRVVGDDDAGRAVPRGAPVASGPMELLRMTALSTMPSPGASGRTTPWTAAVRRLSRRRPAAACAGETPARQPARTPAVRWRCSRSANRR